MILLAQSQGILINVCGVECNWLASGGGGRRENGGRWDGMMPNFPSSAKGVRLSFWSCYNYILNGHNNNNSLIHVAT